MITPYRELLNCMIFVVIVTMVLLIKCMLHCYFESIKFLFIIIINITVAEVVFIQ